MKVGSLFTGYGGLDMAVGGDLAWYSEIEPAACKVLAAHHPGVPNLGDIKLIDWADVPPVDIITGGYPCQPFSHAGLRKGKDDERHLWPYVRDAISALGPRYAVLENVAGHITLGFADVLTDLAEVGYDARWGIVRAADAGAPHARRRLFIVARLAEDAARGTRGTGSGWRVPEPQGAVRLAASDGGHPAADADQHGSQRIERGQSGLGPRTYLDRCGARIGWGRYAAAIRRWECALGRPAPEPTIPGRGGRPRLSAVFVEWMMGLPEGHVTGHGLSNAQCLRMLGNGVVPQQARLALAMLGGVA